MSIYIPGMEIPTSCAFCRFCEGLADTLRGTCAFCAVDGKQRDAQTNDGCPLVPVPPHGRCIDVDVLIKVLETKAKNPFNKETTPYSWAFAYECLADAVKDMPTIIPAIEEGEG